MEAVGLANWLTILRIVLIPVFVSLVVYDRVGLALSIFVLAGLTDAADGYVARSRGTKTRLGTFLDPLADKLLLTASFVTLTYTHPRVLPFWLTALVLSRDVVLVLVTGLILLTGGRVHPEPTVLGKTSTAFQMVTVAAALVGIAAVEDRVAPAQAWLNATTAVLTVGSGLQYLLSASRFVEWESR